jgi:hypothetical protein
MVDCYIPTGKFSYEIIWEYDDDSCSFEWYNSFSEAYTDFCRPLVEGCINVILNRLEQTYNIKKDDYWEISTFLSEKH